MPSRSRSRSPHRDDRDDRRRSRSPRAPKRKDKGGFRWKEKAAPAERDGGDDRRLERGYRERDRERPRSPPPRVEAATEEQAVDKPKKDKKEKKVKKEKKIAPPQEAMIIVNVNDRLGTKASIPCLPSDPISRFWKPPYGLTVR